MTKQVDAGVLMRCGGQHTFVGRWLADIVAKCPQMLVTIPQDNTEELADSRRFLARVNYLQDPNVSDHGLYLNKRHLWEDMGLKYYTKTTSRKKVG